MASLPTQVCRLTLGLIATMALSCASVPKRNPLPIEHFDTATVPGFTSVRFWGDELPQDSAAWFAQTRDDIKQDYPALFGKPHDYLAISGGGANGAFGAGLLVGWSAEGTRPDFQLVTGISIGALTAPFAFLGSDYDHVLREFFTSYGTDDLVKKRSTLSAIRGDALFSTDRLAALIDEYIDDEVVAKIAEEARKGRLLNIGTTNLDANRPVIWRVTAIAASGHPQAADLIRQVILASASIPAAFPPVAIEVEANGQRYDELHVDGGTASQVFLYPAAIDWAEVLQKLESPEMPQIYIIRNSRLDPKAATIQRRMIPILNRSMASLTRTQGVGDLFRIYALAERDGLDFNLAFIPESFDEQPTELFDSAWMGRLFDLGFEMAESGYPWLAAPPQFGDE